MEVVFRVDASLRLGGGHLARCLVLASAMIQCGARAKFLMRSTEPGFASMINNAGFECEVLEVDAECPSGKQGELDWLDDANACSRQIRKGARPFLLVVDHYDLDMRWETRIRAEVGNLMVIDDLANRAHECDWLLDQTFGRSADAYCGLVNKSCRFLLGTEFCLLRPQFEKTRAEQPLQIGEYVPRILHLFFGSVDSRSNTPRFAQLILRNFPEISIRAALGLPNSADERELQLLAKSYTGRFTWKQGISDMAAHIAGCDVAVGAPGGTTWERACLGVPSAYVAIADNQEPVLKSLADAGFCVYLGRDSRVADAEFVTRIRKFLDDHGYLAQIRATGLAAVDGHGAARVAHLVIQEERRST